MGHGREEEEQGNLSSALAEIVVPDSYSSFVRLLLFLYTGKMLLFLYTVRVPTMLGTKQAGFEEA